MALYLVQHGKNFPKEQDPDKGLSDEGRREVERIAEMAQKAGLSLSVIGHSGKKRARQTAEIFASALEPRDGMKTMDGLGPLDDVGQFAGRIDPAENAMFVGHLPFMEKLTSYLLTGETDRSLFKFQNGGIVGLDKGEEGWQIVWALLPSLP